MVPSVEAIIQSYACILHHFNIGTLLDANACIHDVTLSLLIAAVRLQTNDNSMTFRGLVVQSRSTTSTFTPASDFVGNFVTPPSDALWQIWNCDEVREWEVG